MTSQDFEQLPDTPEFHELKQMPGTMLLAPGFNVEFAGSFGVLNGAIAAEQFTMSGGAGGTIRGTVISYGDSEFVMEGNGQVTIDQSAFDGTAPGLKNPVQLEVVEDSYLELAPGSYQE